MKAGVRFSIVGAVMLVALAGCGRGFFQGAERAPWRHTAEVDCLKSGALKNDAGAVRIEPIEGPGVCGMDFPLKVSGLGETPALSFADNLQPPGSIPQASSRMPRWPVHDDYYSSSSRVRSAPPAPVGNETLRWVPGPRAINDPDAGPASEPMSIRPPDAYGPPSRSADAPDAYAPPRTIAPARDARAMPEPDDVPADTILPGGRRPERPREQRAYNAPDYQQPIQRMPPPLGPSRGPYSVASIPQATLKPAAKLACPLVSALDRWVSDGVQPAALRWFNSPVTVIHQIGSYSCREMVGSGSNHISEHAFGNALDVAGFTLADGRTVTVKNGWHGSPQEQGFLHDVQFSACQTFVTVLAPGYNPEHYNHIHVDLMRRRRGYRPCRPTAISGEVAAARARARYANRGPQYTGSIRKQLNKVFDAIAGADGYVGDDDDDAADAPAPAPRPSRPATKRTSHAKEGQSVTY